MTQFRKGAGGGASLRGRVRAQVHGFKLFPSRPPVIYLSLYRADPGGPVAQFPASVKVPVAEEGVPRFGIFDGSLEASGRRCELMPDALPVGPGMVFSQMCF